MNPVGRAAREPQAYLRKLGFEDGEKDDNEAFLLSDQATIIRGQAINVDGRDTSY